VIAVARRLARFVREGRLGPREPGRLVSGAYLAGGTLLVLASALNRISPVLILTSGASTGFGAMAGLLAVPVLVERQASAAQLQGPALPFRPAWLVAGALVGAFFVGVLGPGVSLPQ